MQGAVTQGDRIRAHLQEMFRSALERVDPYRMIKERVLIQGGKLVVRSDREELKLGSVPAIVES
jgi:hypothetical protein